MKIRANLNFFLSKRGGSLAGLCKTNGIKTREELLGLLDDACVAHPGEEDLALLFPARQKAPRKVVRKSEAAEPQARDIIEKQTANDTSRLKGKSKRSSRRRSRRASTSSASEE